MKRTFFITALAFLLIGLLTGCNSMKKLQKEAIETAVIGQINPTQLQAVNGKINFEYTVKFGPKQFGKRMILKITPRMQYGSNVEKLPPIYLQGEKVKGSSYPVIASKSATTVNQKVSMNFRQGMQNGVLWADIEAIQGKKSFMLTPVILNQNGVQVWQNYSIRIDGVNYIPIMTETIIEDVPAAAVGVVSGYVLFPLAQYKIPESQQHSAVMNQATEAMKKVLANPNVKINSGQLLSDEFVIRLIQDSIAHSENVEGFLFDGFPRTVAQAEKLDEILKENGAPLAGLLNIEVPETELKRRMLERAQIEGRADDTEEAIHNRFKEYHAKTVPVAKHYQTICHTVKGDGTMEEVFEEISKIIEKIK